MRKVIDPEVPRDLAIKEHLHNIYIYIHTYIYICVYIYVYVKAFQDLWFLDTPNHL